MSDMKRLKLLRISRSTDVTFGVLIDEMTGLPICLTLELPYKGNQPSISCIPKGIYKVQPYTSDRYRDVFQIMDVPGRTAILIHAGNTCHDTEGCVLPGLKYGKLHGVDAVLESRNALNFLKENVNYESFTLEVA